MPIINLGLFKIGRISSKNHRFYLITCQILEIFAQCSLTYNFISSDSLFGNWLISLNRELTDNLNENLINLCIFTNLAQVLIHVDNSESGNKLLLIFIEETTLLNKIINNLHYTDIIQLLDNLLGRPSLFHSIILHEKFNFGIIVTNIFDIFQENEIDDNWATYLSVLKKLFLILNGSSKISIPIPEIKLPPDIVHHDLFIQLIDFFSLYSSVPDSYFIQFLGFFIDPDIGQLNQKSILHFFEVNLDTLLKLINIDYIMNLITFTEDEQYYMKKYKSRLFVYIQEKNPLELNLFDINQLKKAFHCLTLGKPSETIVIQYLSQITKNVLTATDKMNVYEDLTNYLDKYEVENNKIEEYKNLLEV